MWAYGSSLLLLTLILGTGCSSTECSDDSDCMGGRVCTNNKCVLGGGGGGRLDLGVFDAGMLPDTGIRPDTGIPDAGDAGVVDANPGDGGPLPDSGPPADGGPLPDGGGRPAGNVVIYELQTGQNREHVVQMELLEQGASGVNTVLSAHSDQEGGTCTVVLRTWQTLAPLNVANPVVRIDNRIHASLILGANQRYEPDNTFTPPVGAFVGATNVALSWTEGVGPLRLEAADLRLLAPTQLTMTTPFPGAMISLAGAVSFQWIPSGLVAERILVQMRGTLPTGGDVQLSCETADDGNYVVPVGATQALSMSTATPPFDVTVIRPTRGSRLVNAPGLQTMTPIEVTTGWGARYSAQ